MKETTNVIEFLKEHEINYKKASGAEVTLSTCPFCGTEKGKFYINVDNGLFDCKICREKGNFFKFKRKFGVVDGIATAKSIIDKTEAKPLDSSVIQKYQDDLDRHPEALDYLYSRGFTYETVRKFRLGYVEEDGTRWIAIPHFFEGELWNIKFRSLDAKSKENRFKRVSGQPTVLFNVDNIDFGKSALVLVESETDCMSAVQLGVRNTVGLTAGADTFKAEWLSVFSQFSKIYLMLNMDEAGDAGTEKIANKVGYKRVRVVELPTNDVNDFLKEGGTQQQLRALITQAKGKELNDIKTADKIVDDLEQWLLGNTQGLIGVPTGYKTIDTVTNGLKPGDLITLTGDSGIGKTTFANNVVNSVIRYGVPTLCFFLEGQVNYYISRMMGSEVSLQYTELMKYEDDWKAMKENMAQLPLYVYSGESSELTSENIFEIIKGAVDLHDIGLILIDNLQLVVKDEDVRLETKFITKLKLVCDDLKIPIILIAHVRKPERGVQRALTKHDMRGSGAIYQQSDQVWILQPTPESYFLTLDKVRMGMSGVDVPFRFDAPIGKFEEIGDGTPTNRSEVPVEVED